MVPKNFKTAKTEMSQKSEKFMGVLRYQCTIL